MSYSATNTPGKRGPKRTPAQRLIDMQRTAEWYCQGKSIGEIAKLLGVDWAQADYDLRKIRAAWTDRAVKSFSEHVAEELAKLDQLEKQAWTAWTWSTQRKKEAEREKRALFTKDGSPILRADGKGQAMAVSSQRVAVKARDGDPRFLAVVFQCIDRRIKLLGLDAPVRVQQETALRDLAEAVSAETGVPATELIAQAERIAQAAAARQGLQAGNAMVDQDDEDGNIIEGEAVTVE